MINKNTHRLTNSQIDRLKLLETKNSFQDEVSAFRKKFLINTSNGSISDLKISPIELHIKLDTDLHLLGEKLKLPYSLMRSQIIIYIKYNKWGFDSSFPKKYLDQEQCFGTPIYYDIIVDPIAEMNKNGKISKYSNTVSLVTHARLSTKEQNDALKILREIQELCFNPKKMKQSRRMKDIERDLKTEEEMLNRSPNHNEEIITGHYLTIAKSKYDKGEISLKTFNDMKNKNPNEIEKIRTGKTSSDVAQKLLGNKKYANNARKINSRIKKKRENL